MRLSVARRLALRLTVPQNVPKSNVDRLVYPTAFVLAAFGVGLSSFSLKQMLNSPKRRC